MHERNRREILPFGLLPESSITDLQEALSLRLDSFSRLPGAKKTGRRGKGRIRIPFDEDRIRIIIPYLWGNSTAIHVDSYIDPTHLQLAKRTWVNFSWRGGEEDGFYLGQVIEKGHSKNPQRKLSYPIRTIRALRIEPYHHLAHALSALQDRILSSP